MVTTDGASGMKISLGGGQIYSTCHGLLVMYQHDFIHCHTNTCNMHAHTHT